MKNIQSSGKLLDNTYCVGLFSWSEGMKGPISLRETTIQEGVPKANLNELQLHVGRFYDILPHKYNGGCISIWVNHGEGGNCYPEIEPPLTPQMVLAHPRCKNMADYVILIH